MEQISTKGTNESPSFPMTVLVIIPYQQRNKEEISVDKGTVLSVVSLSKNGAWAEVRCPGNDERTAWIPSNHIRLVINTQSSLADIQSNNNNTASNNKPQNDEKIIRLIPPEKNSNNNTNTNTNTKFLRSGLFPPLSRTPSSPNFRSNSKITPVIETKSQSIRRSSRNRNISPLIIPALSRSVSEDYTYRGPTDRNQSSDYSDSKSHVVLIAPSVVGLVNGGSNSQRYDYEDSRPQTVKFMSGDLKRDKRISPKLRKEYSSPFLSANEKRKYANLHHQKETYSSGDLGSLITTVSQKNFSKQEKNLIMKEHQEEKVDKGGKESIHNSPLEGQRKRIKTRLEKILESNLNKNILPILSTSADADNSLEELIIRKLFKNQTVLIKDRKFQTKTYRNCFVGKEFVDWLIVNNIASSRAEGIVQGNKLLSVGFIESVIDENMPFKDDFLYYRFRNEVPKKKDIKTKISKRVMKSDSSTTTPNSLLSKKDKKRQLQFVLHELEEFYILKPTTSYLKTRKVIPYIVNPKFETFIETQMKEEVTHILNCNPPSTLVASLLSNQDELPDGGSFLNPSSLLAAGGDLGSTTSGILPSRSDTSHQITSNAGGTENRPRQISVRKSLKRITPTSSKGQLKIITHNNLIINNNNNNRQKRILEKKLKEQKEKEKKVKHKENSKLISILSGILEKGKKFKDPPPTSNEYLTYFLPLHLLPPELPQV